MGICDVEFEGTMVFGLGCDPVLVEAGYSESADFELFGGEGFEVGGGEAGDALVDNVALVSVEPYPSLFRHVGKALACLFRTGKSDGVAKKQR